ncbi:MAG TPA: hypothetical protein VNB87_13240 [Propionibacteriaceae bacterium]|nr:hypothetical protein [Propionibacteriaceae bacterium]
MLLRLVGAGSYVTFANDPDDPRARNKAGRPFMPIVGAVKIMLKPRN